MHFRYLYLNTHFGVVGISFYSLVDWNKHVTLQGEKPIISQMHLHEHDPYCDSSSVWVVRIAQGFQWHLEQWGPKLAQAVLIRSSCSSVLLLPVLHWEDVMWHKFLVWGQGIPPQRKPFVLSKVSELYQSMEKQHVKLRLLLCWL